MSDNPELQAALRLLQQYRQVKKLDHIEFSLLQRSTSLAVNAGGTVSIVSKATGLEFHITSKPKRIVKPRKVKTDG